MPSRAALLVDLVVHELRTPLTVAIGSLRQMGALSDPVQQAALARALRSCERLDHLAAEMRDWTRLQDASPEPRAAQLADVVGQALGLVSRGDTPIAVGAVPDEAVQGLPGLLAGALASVMGAVVRAAEPGETVAVDIDRHDDCVTLVARRPGSAAFEAGGTFDAEGLGGLGFSLPLAHAVITGGGGDVTSLQSSDGRLQAISVRLAVAR
jgi:signal transduction histidine kinase